MAHGHGRKTECPERDGQRDRSVRNSQLGLPISQYDSHGVVRIKPDNICIVSGIKKKKKKCTKNGSSLLSFPTKTGRPRTRTKGAGRCVTPWNYFMGSILGGIFSCSGYPYLHPPPTFSADSPGPSKGQKVKIRAQKGSSC